jgi:hypothetical protein
MKYSKLILIVFCIISGRISAAYMSVTYTTVIKLLFCQRCITLPFTVYPHNYY